MRGDCNSVCPASSDHIHPSCVLMAQTLSKVRAMHLNIHRIRNLAVLVAAPVLLAGCMYNPYGSDGGDYGYDDGYYGNGGGGYYGAASVGHGWYDNYYYPGNGYYVYDRAGARHRMRDQDRRHWLERREARAERRDDRREVRADRREERVERREERVERRAARPAPDAATVQRREQRREARQEARQGGGVFNREARQAVRNAVRSRSGAGGPEREQ